MRVRAKGGCERRYHLNLSDRCYVGHRQRLEEGSETAAIFVRPNWRLPWAHTFRRPATAEGPKD